MDFIQPTDVYRYEVCAGIDFGTTSCGLAYSYPYEKERVHVVSQWPDGTISNKITTTVLFDKDERLVAFGEEANSKYFEHIDEGDSEEVYFFQHFKMILYKSKDINEDLYLEEEGGKKMRAINVFSGVIRFLMDYLVSSINKRNTQNRLNDTSVRWVLTVPAIWNHSAKAFMRKAAELAGIQSQHLVIALEPECASVYCQNESKEKISGRVDFKKNDAKYLVLDCGGGTIDVIAHQQIKGSYFKEIHKSTGGDWGGTKVDELFIKYLEQLFTKGNVDYVKERHKEHWLQILKDFQNAKKKIGSENRDTTVSFSLPKGIWNENYFSITDEDIKRGASIKGKRFRVNIDVIKNMIQQVCSDVRCHGVELLSLDELKDIDAMLMVGGFSNSPILVNSVKEIVSSSIPVVVPEEAELAVVKGAVLFGWDQDKIVARRSRYTYGFECSRVFQNGIHSEERAYFTRGKDDEKIKLCDHVFDKLITINQEVKINETINKIFTPRDIDMADTFVSIYVTSKNEVTYTDEEGVELVGRANFIFPNVEKGFDRKLRAQFMFGGTELKVEVVNESSKQTLLEQSFIYFSN